MSKIGELSDALLEECKAQGMGGIFILFCPDGELEFAHAVNFENVSEENAHELGADLQDMIIGEWGES